MIKATHTHMKGNTHTDFQKDTRRFDILGRGSIRAQRMDITEPCVLFF